MNENEYRFSVIIPCRNSAGTVVRLLDSVARQTFPLERVEVVAVDDASTDSTPRVLERFGSGLPNFRLLRNERRRGCGGARNAGIAEAKGEYLVYADSDDWFTDRAFERFDAALAEAGGPDILLFPYLRNVRPGMPDGGVHLNSFDRLEDIVGVNVGAWAKVVKRSCAARFPEGVMGEDVVWHYAQCDRVETAAHVPGDEPCYVYDRTVDGSITDTNQWVNGEPRFLERLAFDDVLPKAGRDDRWVSDMLRNLANMYDLRHSLSKPWVKAAWKERFAREASALRAGFYVK